MKHFVLTAVGEDRPGIVADLTKVLYREGFNIEDSAMTRLNNEFAVMLIVTTEKEITEQELKNIFDETAKKRNLLINIREIPENIYTQKKETGDIYNIVVYGADKPGIVYKVAKLLSDKGINIADLRTEKSPDLYVLISQVEFPAGLKEEDILDEIEKLKQELSIDISIEKVESVEM